MVWESWHGDQLSQLTGVYEVVRRNRKGHSEPGARGREGGRQARKRAGIERKPSNSQRLEGQVNLNRCLEERLKMVSFHKNFRVPTICQALPIRCQETVVHERKLGTSLTEFVDRYILLQPTSSGKLNQPHTAGSHLRNRTPA